MYITENGWSDRGQIEDNDRIEYLRDHLQQIQDVILKNETNLKGYAGYFDRFQYSLRRFK